MFLSSKLAMGLAGLIAAGGALVAGSMIDDNELPNIGDPIVMTDDDAPETGPSGEGTGPGEKARDVNRPGDDPDRDDMRSPPRGGADDRRDDGGGGGDDGGDDVDVVYPEPEPVDDNDDDDDDDDGGDDDGPGDD